MADRNLDAYYYSFEQTGCDAVDAILEAVAQAGAGYHSTEDWNETRSDGESAASRIQVAANASAATVSALISESEEQAERLRMFELIHGGRASELVSEAHALRAEVRRLKILAGEDVPPLPEEFVGPMPENCYARLRRKINEQAGAPAIPANLNGLADAAFAMADRGEDPSDMLAMLQAGLKKAQPQWSEQKTRTVNGMCMTWRHDFGLDKREHDFGSCGMADAEREALRRQMGQLFEHHVAPVIAENEALTLQAMSHEQAARYWKKRFDEDTTEAIDLLRAEREALASLLRRFVDGEHNAAEDLNDRHWYFTESETLLAKLGGKYQDYALVPEDKLYAQRAGLAAEQRRAAVLEQNCAEMAAELERVRAEAETLKGSCKALGKENTALTRRLKKAERALLWFPENIGFLKPKWLKAVLDGLGKGGKADG